MEEKRKAIIAVDFDGTLCVDCYPGIGAPNRRLIRWLTGEKENGSRLILWTCRGRQGLAFDAVNDNLDEIKMRYGSNARKIFADIYIDDRACVPEAALAWQQGKQADG